mmetsp:Transcript_49467/g.112278  ORF Transcript_49467/g.112278 Transcript_49467/m.112278 type:complete len:307 (-) Transcript_49467:48-968(-)
MSQLQGELLRRLAARPFLGARRGLRTVPAHIFRPPYAVSGVPAAVPPHVVLHNTEEVAALRRAGRIARDALELACSLAAAGKTTNEVDAEVHEAIVALGAYPAPLNYRGFPKSVCAAVNEEICHGIPSERPLKPGDICKFDVSIYTKEGFFGDNCATVLVGRDQDGAVDAAAIALDAATKESVAAALERCVPGGCLSDLGHAIADVCDARGFSSVENFCGHGIGRGFHMAPYVQHFRNDDKLRLEPGMVFTIEPMICEGSSDCRVLEVDGWTVVTLDGKRAAQYEHMVAITNDGHEVLTVGDPALF